MMVNKQVKQSVSILSLISGARKGKQEATHTTTSDLQLCPNKPRPVHLAQPNAARLCSLWFNRDSSFLELCGEDPRLSVRIRLDLLGCQIAAC